MVDLFFSVVHWRTVFIQNIIKLFDCTSCNCLQLTGLKTLWEVNDLASGNVSGSLQGQLSILREISVLLLFSSLMTDRCLASTPNPISNIAEQAGFQLYFGMEDEGLGVCQGRCRMTLSMLGQASPQAPKVPQRSWPLPPVPYTTLPASRALFFSMGPAWEREGVGRACVA